MKPPMDKAPEERFDAAFRKWTERPPRLSPGAAAARVASLIRERRPRRQPRWALGAAAAALFAVVAVAIHWATLSTTPPVPPVVVAVQETPRLGEGEVLMWLDKDTPLYMTFQPPAEDRGKGGKQ
jgi:hypothetical protein